MEFVFGAGDYSVQCSDQVLQLFSTRQSLLKFMTEKSGASGGKRPAGKLPAVAQSYLQSCLSLPSVLSMFKGLYRLVQCGLYKYFHAEVPCTKLCTLHTM